MGLSPVVIQGRAIARTFWGKAWCGNLERYSDFANRLPRGRTYLRHRAVLDLQIAPGEVTALVRGSENYRVAVHIAAVPKSRWTSLCHDCAGGIDSLVDLLRGELSRGVMERLCRPETGLFPAPGAIRFECSCPDSAAMCKHVAAVLYGVGARLDVQPELLFMLRRVHERDLIASAGSRVPLSKQALPAGRVLVGRDLSKLFGLELAPARKGAVPAARAGRKQPARQSQGRPKGKPPGRPKKPRRAPGR